MPINYFTPLLVVKQQCNCGLRFSKWPLNHMETKYSNEDATSQVQLEFFQIIKNADKYRVIKIYVARSRNFHHYKDKDTDKFLVWNPVNWEFTVDNITCRSNFQTHLDLSFNVSKDAQILISSLVMKKFSSYKELYNY